MKRSYSKKGMKKVFKYHGSAMRMIHRSIRTMTKVSTKSAAVRPAGSIMSVNFPKF